jgi:micrococcal nuclease
MTRTIPTVFAFTAALVVTACGGSENRTSAQRGPGAATVVRVIDGDTLVVRLEGHDEHLRMIGIDTPESVAPDRPVECYGKEASTRTAQLVPPGTAVRIARDVEPRDRYGRLLGYVYRAKDNVLVNQTLVQEGFAEAKEYPPNTAMQRPLEAAESQARAKRAGLWGACGNADVPLR